MPIVVSNCDYSWCRTIWRERTCFCDPRALQSDPLLRYGVNLHKVSHGVGQQDTETKLQKMKSPSSRAAGETVKLVTAGFMINLSSIYTC